jgi:transcriptional regulator with XRE-family HTH domain
VTATTHRRSCRTCGWCGSYASAKKADWAKRRHSCEYNLRKAAASARHQARQASVDRTPRPCLHKIAAHVHGTYACYVLDACRCPPCSHAVVEYERNRLRQQAYGRWDNYVDAGPARAHVLALMGRGMGLKRICVVGGASGGQLWKLLYGKKKADGSRTPSRRIKKDVAQRLLSIELDLADGAVVPSTTTARRLQALVANGWSQSQLAARLGMERSNFGPLVHGTRDTTAGRAKAVHALYAELVDIAPPPSGSSTRARRYAAQHGWAPPLRIGGKPWIGQPLDLDDEQEAAS